MAQLTRALRGDDFEQALPLYAALSGDSDLGTRQDFERLVSFPGTKVFGALNGNKVLAIATLHILPNMTKGARPYALIENVVTAPNAQGQGFGRAVMNAAIAEAWAQNAYKVMLQTGTGAQAKGFYEKLGFTGDTKHAMELRKLPARTLNG